MSKSKKSRKAREPFDLGRELEKLGQRPSPQLACAACQAVLETGNTEHVLQAGHDQARRRLEWDRTHAALMARAEALRQRQARKQAANIGGAYADVAGAQEAHSPTVRQQVRDIVAIDPKTGAQVRQSIEGARMRLAEARLMNALDNWQQDAAQEIADAAAMVTGGVSIRGQSFERTARGHVGEFEPQWRVDLQAAYFKWARELQRLGIDHAAIFAVLVQGKTLAEADRMRQARNGHTSVHLRAGLDLWCWHSHWKREPGPAVGAVVAIWLRRWLGGAQFMRPAEWVEQPKCLISIAIYPPSRGRMRSRAATEEGIKQRKAGGCRVVRGG